MSGIWQNTTKNEIYTFLGLNQWNVSEKTNSCYCKQHALFEKAPGFTLQTKAYHILMRHVCDLRGHSKALPCNNPRGFSLGTSQYWLRHQDQWIGEGRLWTCKGGWSLRACCRSCLQASLRHLPCPCCKRMCNMKELVKIPRKKPRKSILCCLLARHLGI